MDNHIDTLGDLIATGCAELLQGKIASFKIPKYIQFQDEFPLTGSGKVKKYVLKERLIKEFNL